MGLFGGNYNRPGPGVPKDAPPKKGIPRFFEMLTRDYAPLWRTGFVTMLCFVPLVFSVTVIYAFLGYLIPMLIGAVLYVLSSMLAGMAVAAQTAVTFKAVRDIPGFAWHDYKKAWKDNAKQARVIGVLMFALLGIECSSLVFMLFSGTQFNAVVLGMAILGILLCTGCGMLCFAQMIYLTMDIPTMIKNSLFLLFGYLKRTLPGTLFILVPYAAAVLFLPIPFWPLFFLLGFHNIVLLGYGQWVWPVLDSTFTITQRQRERDAQREAEAAAAEAAASAPETPADRTDA